MVLKRAIDSLSSSPGTLGRYTALLVALALGQALFKFTSRRLFLGRARRVEHDLRAAYFERLLRLPIGFIERGRKGDLVSRATRDLQDIRLFLGAGVLNFLQTLLLLGAAVVLLYRIHPNLTFAALAPFPVISVLVCAYSPRLHRRYLEANQRAGDLSALIQEALSGGRVVAAYDREQWQRERVEEANEALRDAESRVIWSWALLFPFVGAIAGLGHVVVLGLGGYWVSRGALTLGDFVAFNAYLAMLTWPMIALGWTLSLVERGAAALDRMGEVLNRDPEPDGEMALAVAGDTCLEVRGVGFAYDGAEGETLSGIDLALPEGSFWGLVGPTGSGKSTLVQLLARLRRPGTGSIQVHGADLGRTSGRDLRRHVAVVPQGGFFFADTVAANVCLGRPRDEAQLHWALSAGGLEHEVQLMPLGVDTPVGEGGVTLSGGQRQRLALARALYGRPATLLLDAALSSLDTETARKVLSGMRRALPHLTLLVVSHRGAEVDEADGVYFLRRGRIQARGRHQELLGQIPEYLQLYREEELRKEWEEAAG
jgi:ATP-binding cassette subfamily B multidrug efflux pump